jgi:hypothetical protein
MSWCQPQRRRGNERARARCPAAMALLRGSPTGYGHHCLYRDDFFAIKGPCAPAQMQRSAHPILSKRQWKVACPAASASSGSAIRRLNGAGSLRRSDSIRNRCNAGPGSRITGANAVELRAQARPPGTEFLDAETGRHQPPLKCANAHGDQNPGIEWPEIPAETPYLASYRKRTVCGDWMVGAPGLEPGPDD